MPSTVRGEAMDREVPPKVPIGVSAVGNDLAADFEYASLVRRFAAFVVDFFAYTTLQVGGTWLLLSSLAPLAATSDAVLEGMLTGYCIAVTWLYYALMECSLRKATLGKIALGIKVIDLHGNRIGFLRASVRFFAKFISMIGCVGFFIIDFTKKKQGLHDMIAGCLVIKRASPNPFASFSDSSLS